MSAFVFATGRYQSGDWDASPLVPANLIDSVARYTSIDVAPAGIVVALDSPALFEYPLVYLTGHLPMRFTDGERRHVRQYLDRGGLLFVDDHNHDVGGVFHRTATEALTQTAGPLSDLPNNDELYSCFFRFPDGPPTTSHELNGWGDNLVHTHLQAARRDDRIAVLYSSKDYSSEWGYHPEIKRQQSIDNTKFGVNIIVYALTR
jgi:hypothetical protein